MVGGVAKQDETLGRLTEKLSTIKRMFSEPANLELPALTLDAVQNAVNKLSLNFNIHQCHYLDEFLDEIIQITSEPTDTFADRIEEAVWFFNFNSRPVFLYLINRISNKVSSGETIAGKIELLAFELKKVNQRVCNRGSHFTERYPGLQDILHNWLMEEMNFLRTRLELTGKSTHSVKAMPNEFKIALDLSVAQFSCLVRGLIEKKLILNTNLTELAAFLASSVVTKRSENISEGSFRRKYYNIEDSTKKSVIEVLNKTIDWLMKS